MKLNLKLILVSLAAASFAGSAFAQFHGSARVIPPDGTRENQVFMFTPGGTMTGQYDQIAGAYEDSWGYRDGTFDGTYVYFGWGGGVARHNQTGTGGILQIAGGAPGGVGTWRGLAHDPTLNGGAGGFWTQSFGSALIAADMAGNLLTTFANNGSSIYGLSYDNTDGNLWGHDGSGDVINIDTGTGLIIAPDPQFTTGFVNLAAQGGLSGFQELGGNLAAVSQGTPDEGGVYDTAASVAGGVGVFVAGGGPWNWEAMSGSNGHLGVAVVPEPATIFVIGIGLAALAARRRRK